MMILQPNAKGGTFMDNYEVNFPESESTEPSQPAQPQREIPKKPSPFADSPYVMAEERPTYSYAEPATPAPKSKKSGKKVLKGILSCLLVVCLVATGCFVTARSVNGYWEIRNQQTQEVLDELQGKLDDLQQQIKDNSYTGNGNSVSGTPNVSADGLTPGQVYAKCVHSVVAISAEIVSSQGAGSSSGSGFILTDDGYVVSNYHVVEGATTLTVTTHAGDKYTAELIGYDDTNDLSLLKVEATDLPAAELGSSNELIVGDQVAAIGNPLGELNATLTVGYVSGKDRTVSTTGAIINMIQTDAAINPGNSGGPLFNMKGQVVGITTAKYSGTTASGASIEGIGFAIPIDDIKGKLTEIRDNGYVSSPYMGVSVTDQYAGMGAYVVSVEPDGGAAAAGIRPGDLIVALGDYEITCINDLTPAMKPFKVGDTTTIVVFRGRQTLELTITFGERPHENTTVPPTGNGDMPSSGSYEDWFDFFFGDGNG